ncbi:MAG: hypothetical protein ACRDRN_23805 [Sciscionella sp.]
MAKERFDVTDLDGGPVGFAAVGDEEDSQVPDCGEPGIERVVPAWSGTGCASPVASREEVLGEPCRSGPQGLWHGLDAALAPGGGVAFLAPAGQRQLAAGEEVLQGAGQPAVVGRGAFQQRLGVGRTSVDQHPPEVGEEGAGVPGVVARREIDGELGQPRRRMGQCRSQVGGANEHPVWGSVPAAATPSGTGQPGDLSAVHARRIRVRWPSRARAGPAPAGRVAQDAAFPTARARRFLDLASRAAAALPADVAIFKQHRRPTAGAGA